MIRIIYFFYFFIGFLLAGMFSANAKSLEASFIGNEAFRVTDGDYVLLTDFPYKSGVYGYMKYTFNFPGTTGNVLSLITHRHDDHFMPLLFSEQNWKIIGPKEVTLPLDQNRVVKLDRKMTFGPMEIMPRWTNHANVEHLSYLVKWQGYRMYFTGDTEDLSALEGLPPLDALIITPWFYRKAKMNEMVPETEKIIIYHHKEKDIIPDCANCIIPVQDQIINIK